jgi:hypothetical protein
VRASKVLALLAEQERKFERERREFSDERSRLLDRIMLLADKPMIDLSAWDATPEPLDHDISMPDLDYPE